MQRDDGHQPMVRLLDELGQLGYTAHPYGLIFDLLTPDRRLTITITEAEYFRDPDGCVHNIRQLLRKAGYSC